MRSFLFAAAAALAAAATAPAYAGPALDMAKARIEAIVSGDSAALMAAYAETARLDWVGGPLDGTYDGAAAIAPVWTKFVAAQGKQSATVSETVEAANPAGATVAMNVVFKGEKTVPVLYVMTFRGEKLVGETWQVNPPAK